MEIAKCEKEPPPVLQKGLAVITSSFSLIGDTVGLGIEVGVSSADFTFYDCDAVINICLDGKPQGNVLASCIQMKIFRLSFSKGENFTILLKLFSINYPDYILKTQKT